MTRIASLIVFALSFITSLAKGEMLKHRSPLHSDPVPGRSVEHGLGRVSTPHDSKSNRNIDNPETVLESAECESFMEELGYEMDNLLTWTDDVIIDYICNSIEMAEISNTMLLIEEDVAAQPDPCMKAYEQLLLNDQETVYTALADEQSCKAEMQYELAVIESRRNLAEGQGRELFIMGFIGCISLSMIAIAAGAATTVIATDAAIDALSDERLKTDIHLVGSSPSGLPIYTFKYREGMNLAGGASLDTESVYFGTMAQDVMELVPDAVKKNTIDGYYRVDYSKIDVDFLKIAE